MDDDEIEKVCQILEKHHIDPFDEDAAFDAVEDYDGCYYDLFEYYCDEMPYGTAKARTGDPEVWIRDRLTNVLADMVALNGHVRDTAGID